MGMADRPLREVEELVGDGTPWNLPWNDAITYMKNPARITAEAGSQELLPRSAHGEEDVDREDDTGTIMSTLMRTAVVFNHSGIGACSRWWAPTPV